MAIKPRVDRGQVSRAARHPLQRSEAAIEQAQCVVDAGQIGGATCGKISHAEIACIVRGHNLEHASLRGITSGDACNRQRMGGTAKHNLICPGRCYALSDHDGIVMTRTVRAVGP